MAEKAAKGAARPRRTKAWTDATKSARAQRFSGSAYLNPSPEQARKLADLCVRFSKAWGLAVATPGTSGYSLEKVWADSGNGDRTGRDLGHCAIREVQQKLFYKAPVDVTCANTFRVGAKSTWLEMEGLLIDAIGEPIPMERVTGFRLAAYGAPYVSSCRVTWSERDGWRASFLLRPDADDALKQRARNR